MRNGGPDFRIYKGFQVQLRTLEGGFIQDTDKLTASVRMSTV